MLTIVLLFASSLWMLTSTLNHCGLYGCLQRQFHRLVEMLVLKHMDPSDERANRAYRLQVKERLYRFNYVRTLSFVPSFLALPFYVSTSFPSPHRVHPCRLSSNPLHTSRRVHRS